MQIVIEIPDAPIKDYQDLFYKIHGMAASEGLFDDKKPSERAKALGVILKILIGIVNGTLLPKGHGDLIDRNDLLQESYCIDDYEVNIVDVMTVKMVDAIIEADTESEDKE